MRYLGIATAADGDLAVLEEYYPSTGGHRCRVDIESATATASSAPLTAIDCSGSYTDQTGYGIARNPTYPAAGDPGVPAGDAFDVLVAQDSTGAEYVQRYDELGSALNSIVLPSTAYRTLADDRGGRPYVADTSGDIIKYQPTSAGSSPRPAAQLTFPGGSGGSPLTSPMAVSQLDQTLWVGGTSGGKNYVYGYTPNAGSYPSTPTKTVGPMSNAVTALALDQEGNLYIGVSSIPGVPSPNRNAVHVYNVSGTGTPTAVRSLPNPVPGNPTDITGLAISEGTLAASPVQQVQPNTVTFGNYALGPVRGQNGWLSNSCGNNDYNANVVASSSYPNANWGGNAPSKVLQIDNSVTQGCFSGLGTPVTAQTAGIPTAITDPSNLANPPHCGADCQPYFTTQFVVTSATGGFQPALEMSISPVWTNDGARQQYIGLWHTQDANGANKLLIFTNDVDDVIGNTPPCYQCADFVPWEIAYVDPTQPHTVGMTMQFVAPDSDVVEFYVDGSLAGVQKEAFRSWEDYYLYDTESDPGYVAPYSRAVNDLLLHPGNVDSCLNFQDYANDCNQRTTGPGHTANAGNGFLFSSIVTCAGTASGCASSVSMSARANGSSSAANARSVQSAARSLSTHLVARKMSALR